jgi:nitrate/TMAO reductase-like tetraheme cytochrome c subunit
MFKDKRVLFLKILVFALGIGFLVIALAGFVRSAAAATAPSTQPALTISQAVDNATCLSCHSKPGLTRTLPSGETLSLTIDETHFTDSAHKSVACSECHTNITAFPHPDLTVQTLRDFSLQMYTVCQKCHEEQYNRTLDSVHMKAVAAGNTEAAICTDCHNPHTQAVITGADGGLLPEARLMVPETCARCHSTIYETYKQSVHGAALTQEGNTDVPTCIDCHGVHNYVADFHGTTVTLFEQTSPDQATNKPVCFDCHGVHDIKRVDDPVYGLAMKQNLLTACQRCHPDANTNFPDAWMSHYIPSPSHYSLVYYVNLFYKFFIPAVIGGMLIFVLSDIVRRLIGRIKGVKHA